VEYARTEFHPDPGHIRARQRLLRWRMAWLASITAFAGTVGFVPGSRWSTGGDARLVAPLGVGALLVGAVLVGIVGWRHHQLARVLRDGLPLVLHPEALVLPGELPRPWSDVRAAVLHRLNWAGIEITLVDRRRVRLRAEYLGTTADELGEAFGRHIPVGDPEAAYGAWGRYLNDG
jgi:hypothetical protein